MENNAWLVLENGRTFAGKSFGAAGEVLGEVVFTTGMTGYLETLTDPSYYGQIVVQTFPMIGNYGVIASDFESASPWVKGYIVREWCPTPSNFRSGGDLDGFLKEKGIPGLWGIDTRALTKAIREAGVMNGIITTNPAKVDKKAIAGYRIQDAVASVSPGKLVESGPEKGPLVALWDFGAKSNIRRELEKRGCRVGNLPAHSTAEEILRQKPDGVLLSNGPGDPADNKEIIGELRKLLESGVPVFGICLGHQLLALAAGGSTVKLKYGHRGANHPVRDTQTGRVWITSQNHGYAVLPESIDANVGTVRYLNANDGTCEGVDYHQFPAFSVQFHPEAAAGPGDTAFLFDRFIDRIGGEQLAAQ